MIPKIVYQTWYDKKKIPLEYRDILESNIKMNPEYQFVIMDDHDLDNFFEDTQIPLQLRNIYQMINPHYGPSRADLFRYTIIYLKGGIYLDIKIRCKIPFRDWIKPNAQYLLSYWENLYYQKQFLNNEKGELQNWHVIARQFHPYLKKVLNILIHNIMNRIKSHEQGKGSVLIFTGPITDCP